MMHCLQVLAVVVLVFTPSILSVFPTLHDNSKITPSNTEKEIQSQKPKPKVNTAKGEVEVKPEHVDELNEMISRYLLTFETKKKDISDQNLLNVMDTMKLLIAQSWIRTSKPDPNLVTLEETDLETLSVDIENELKMVNIRFPVVDAIITYTNEIEPKMTEYFEKKRKYLENFQDIINKNIEKATDAKNEIDVDHLKSSWKEIFYTLNQINENLVVHRLASKMYIQSYILNFISERARPEDKITLISTDKKRSKRFRVPSMEGMDIYSHLLLGDAAEMDKIILNQRISQYMIYFEDERRKTSDTNLNRSMNVIKHLIVQGWIENLNPPPLFLLPEHSTKKKEDIIRDLVQINVNHPVRDAILLYTKEKEKSIRNQFEIKKTNLMKEYEKIENQIVQVPSNQQAETMNTIEKEVNELQDLLLAHDIAKLFYLHSYQDNFVTEKSDILEIKSSDGLETKKFKLPPINLLSFYDDPIFD